MVNGTMASLTELVSRSAQGQKRTSAHFLEDVCFTPESGHSEPCQSMSAVAPKRLITFPAAIRFPGVALRAEQSRLGEPGRPTLQDS